MNYISIPQLEKTRKQIAYQDFLYDDAKVNAVVSAVRTRPDTYYKNTLGFYKLWVDDNMRAFDEVIDGHELVNIINRLYFISLLCIIIRYRLYYILFIGGTRTLTSLMPTTTNTSIK